MRLLIDAHVFDGKYQGTRTYLHGLYGALIKISPEIDFYLAAHDINNLQSVFGVANNVHYVRLKSKNKLIRLAFEFPIIIKKYKIDYAHYQYISPLLKTCKEIVTVHDLLFLEFPQYFPSTYRLKNKFFFKRSAYRADILLTVSEYSKNQISKCFDIPQERIFLTPNAVAEDFLEQIEKNNSFLSIKYGLDKFILYVGRIEPRKNHKLLTKAVVELGLLKQGYKLVYIGVVDIKSAEHSSYLETLSSEEKSQIIFLKEISNKELIQFYAGAEIFIFPSLAEGFGIPPLEALSMKTQCLCSNSTAMRDFDFMGERFFDPTNENELKKKILDALNNKIPPIDDMIVEHIRKKYNWGNIASKYKRILFQN